MIGREKTDNIYPHRAEGIALNLFTPCALRYAPGNSLIGVSDEDLGDRGLWVYRK
jgi:hypothetical protein